MCNNNCYNGCGNNRSYYNGGECGCDSYASSYNSGCGCSHHTNCGCNDFDRCGDNAFYQAARVTNRIMARRACEDRSAAQYLRNISNCRRCW